MSVELWDLVDRQGRPTGRRHRRGEPVPDGAFHIVGVGFCLDASGRLLTSHRVPTKEEFPDMWEFPGGSALAGEGPQAATLRELREETGLPVDRAHVRSVGDLRIVPDDPGLYACFVVRFDEEAPATRPQAGETDGFAWLALAEIEEWISRGELTPPDAALYGAIRGELAA